MAYSLAYYDGHIHTTRSDGSGSVADVKAAALRRGLSIVIITDHCATLTEENWESLLAEAAAVSDPGAFLALPGFEITGAEGLFNRSHVVAYDVRSPFVGGDAGGRCAEFTWPDPPNPAGTGPVDPETIARWADFVHSQGGIAIHCHTSGTTRLSYGVDGIEVYNQSAVDDIISYAKLAGVPDEEALELAITLNALAVNGERDLNNPVSLGGETLPLRVAIHSATKLLTGVGQWLGSPEAPLISWDQLLMAHVEGVTGKPIFAVANSDAHNTADADSNVGIARNGLYVEALTPEHVYQAIRAGRSFATTGPSIAFEVNGQQMGGTVRIDRAAGVELKLRVSSESPAYALARIDIIRNGKPWRSLSPMQPVYENTLHDSDVTRDGYYRVEVTSQDAPGGSRRFAWSNPVFVKVRQGPSQTSLQGGTKRPFAAS